jgi:hypothetical protein
VPGFGWAVCAGLQAAAFAVRTTETVTEEGGWEKNKNKIMLDGFTTAVTAGLAAPMRLARYGTLAPIKGAPISPFGKAIKPFQTQAWNNLPKIKISKLEVPIVSAPLSLVPWTVPSFVAKDAEADWPILRKIVPGIGS